MPNENSVVLTVDNEVGETLTQSIKSKYYPSYAMGRYTIACLYSSTFVYDRNVFRFTNIGQYTLVVGELLDVFEWHVVDESFLNEFEKTILKLSGGFIISDSFFYKNKCMICSYSWTDNADYYLMEEVETKFYKYIDRIEIDTRTKNEYNYSVFTIVHNVVHFLIHLKNAEFDKLTVFPNYGEGILDIALMDYESLDNIELLYEVIRSGLENIDSFLFELEITEDNTIQVRVFELEEKWNDVFNTGDAKTIWENFENGTNEDNYE